MLLFSRRKGLSVFMLLGLIAVLAIITGMGFGVWEKFVGSMVGKSCKGLCKDEPKKATKMGCWCGTQGSEGRYLHLSAAPGSPTKVYAFHLTNLPLPDLSDYKKEKNADLQDGCDDHGADLDGWEIQAKDYEGCKVYVVNKEGDDECALYGVDEGENLTGDTSPSEELEENEINSNGDGGQEIWNSLSFDEEIELKYRDLAGQKFLLKYPYGDASGRTDFTLWKEIERIECVKEGQEYKWRKIS